MSDKNQEQAVGSALSELHEYMDEEAEKQYKKFWHEINLPLTLKEGLSTYTKAELDAIRRNMEIANASSLKKADLQKVLEERIPDLGSQYLLWDDERFGLLAKIAEKGGYLSPADLEADQVAYIRCTGLIFSGSRKGKPVLAVPAKLIEPVRKLAGNDEVKAVISRNTEWINLTKGLLYYYGTLSIDSLMDLMEKYTGKTLELKSYLQVIHEAIYFRSDIHIDEAGFSNRRVFDPKKVLQEQQSRSGLSYYPFTKQQLMAAGEPDFVDRSKAYMELVRYLIKNYSIDKEGADEIAEECLYAANIGHGPNDVMEYLSYTIEFDNLETVQEVMGRVVNVMNHTRQWNLKGHTPGELFQEEKDHLRPLPSGGPILTKRREVAKVGRNEPCPCGSGKKYKKCCGR
nr:SEC-C metal-binding domain-containing protein [Bacillus salacetis]